MHRVSQGVMVRCVKLEYGCDKLPPLPAKIVFETNNKCETGGREENFGPGYRMKLEMVRSWVRKDGCPRNDIPARDRL